jgi:Cu/Ag efflux protein CusF
MLRKLCVALAVVVCGSTLAIAETIPGKIKKIDTEKSTITITVDGEDTTYTVDKASKIFQPGKTKKQPTVDVPGGLSGLKEGQPVVLTTEKKDSKDVVTQIKLEEAATKKKK